MARRKARPKTPAPGEKRETLSSQAGSWLHDHLASIVIVLFLSLATLIVYWPVRNHEFIDLDDYAYVVNNPQVQRGLNVQGLIWTFTSTDASNWHPLTWLSHMLDCQLFGLNPGWHHFINLMFHIGNTLFLFFLLKRMVRGLWVSGFVASLFALHPLHVESVAWVAERKDVLSTFFWVLTLWAYMRYVEERTIHRYLLVFFSFFLGLLSKPMLVTLPFLLLLLDYWPLGRVSLGQLDSEFSRGPSVSPQSQESSSQGSAVCRLVYEKTPLFVLSAISSLITYFVQQKGGAVTPLESIPLLFRIANALVSYLMYIGKMVWPHPLAILYPYPVHLPLWQVVGAALFLVWVSILVIWARKRRPYLLVGWFWYIGTLVPVIGLVQVGLQSVADRYTYVPLIGLFIIIGTGVPELVRRWGRPKMVLPVLAGLVICSLIIITRIQVSYWENTITLYRHALAATSDNAVIHHDLGKFLAGNGKIQEGIVHYIEALRIWPNYTEAHRNLGLAFFQQGNFHEAIVHYKQALRIYPNSVETHNDLGVALAEEGKTQEAMAHYAEALRIRPNFAEAHVNLGEALATQGKVQEAMAHYAEALRIRPNFAEAHVNLGEALAGQGRVQEAITHYNEALRIKPNCAEAHSSLGNALAREGRLEEALAHHNEALRIDPQNAQVHNNLGTLLAEQGKIQEAIVHFAEALRIKPDYARASYNLAYALFLQGRTQEAIGQLIRTLQIKRDYAEARYYLGLAYLKIGNRAAAMEEYRILQKIDPKLAKILSQKIPK
jgi:tetratricopeptide (TPR) repeat protein